MTIKGAARVMVVDRHPDRLRLAEQIGAIAIDDSQGSAVDQVKEHTGGLGADRGCECVGYQAHDPQGHEDNSATLNDLVSSVRFTGGIGTIGVFVGMLIVYKTGAIRVTPKFTRMVVAGLWCSSVRPWRMPLARMSRSRAALDSAVMPKDSWPR